MPATLTVDPSEVQAIHVDPSEVQAIGESHPVIDAAKSLGSGFAQGINPFHGLLDTLDALGKDPIGTVKSGALNVLAHPYMALSRAWDAAKAGKPEEAAVHLANAFEPAGFQTEEAEVKTATPGQRLEGLGQLIGQGAGALITGEIPVIGNKALDVGGALADTPAGKAALKAGPQMIPSILKRPIGTFLNTYRDEIGRQAVEELPTIENPTTVLSESAGRPILDQISNTPGMGGKPFDQLTAPEQAHVRSIADSIEGKKPPALPPPGPKTVETGEPPYVSVPRGTLNRNGTPLRPPLAQPEPPIPEQPPPAPGAAAGPVRPPLAENPVPEAYRNSETTGVQGRESAARTAVAQKIGQKIVDMGITPDQLDVLAKNPEAAKPFWEAIGRVHKAGYVPSGDTIEAVREFVKSAAPKSSSAETVNLGDIPANLRKNPAALKAARALLKEHVKTVADLMGDQ